MIQNNRQNAHQEIDHIFKELLPAHGMAERPAQVALSHRMLDAMLDDSIALCDAGTGIGKTYAYLVAGIVFSRSRAARGLANQPVLISTSSIALQNAVLEEYLPFLSSVLIEDQMTRNPIRAVLRKGKSHYVCDERLKRRLQAVDLTRKSPRARDALLSLRDHLDLDMAEHLSGYDRARVGVPKVCDCGRESCRYQCFMEVCASDWYQVQICNHNLLLADAIHRNLGRRPLLPEWSTLILDEAHKLPEAARQMFGVTLTAAEIRELIRALRRERYYVENNHPAIIPREWFQRVKEEMTRRASKRKVMQRHGKTELGKYSAKYALSELLVCGECGTPYKRCTWARNGKKRIVWRCVSRLEFGTKYCHGSPTLDEEKLHQAILEALNEFAQADSEVKEDVLNFTRLVWTGQEADGTSLISLKQRLGDITAEQALLLDRVLENMNDPDLNAQLKALMDEKQAVQEQIQAMEQEAAQSENRMSRMAELREWMAKLGVNTEYNDEQVRMAVERITVVDAETIHIKFRYPGLEMDKKLN